VRSSGSLDEEGLARSTRARRWVPSHIAIDQSIYALTYNIVFYSAVGLGRGDGLSTVFADLKSNIGKLMTAGWKLWPFVHIVTYGLIPRCAPHSPRLPVPADSAPSHRVPVAPTLLCM